jgi:hypothetical protein
MMMKMKGMAMSNGLFQVVMPLILYLKLKEEL